MDMKKKLENAYIPDKGTQKEKVLIGLSGGIDSFVTAYLLKIQKYDLVAATIINSWDDLETEQSKSFSCHIDGPGFEKIKDFCQRMNIPLHVIRPNSEFKEKVVETWLGQKLLGKFPSSCLNCHDLRMEILYQKMKEVGARHFATGHYAKIFHQEAHESVFVHTSNEEKHDQSALLARLPHEILNALTLPLSDLTKKEVLKLAENFGLIEEPRALQMHDCLTNIEDIYPVLQKRVPKRFLAEGDISNFERNVIYGQHAGVLFHTAGKEMDVRDSGKAVKMIMDRYQFNDKAIIVASGDHFKRNRFLLVNCKFSEEVNWTEPLKGFVSTNQHEELECWIFPKSLSGTYIELSAPAVVYQGEIVSVIKKKGKNAKIFLTGEVQYLALEEVSEEGVQSVQKFNVTLDF